MGGAGGRHRDCGERTDRTVCTSTGCAAVLSPMRYRWFRPGQHCGPASWDTGPEPETTTGGHRRTSSVAPARRTNSSFAGDPGGLQRGRPHAEHREGLRFADARGVVDGALSGEHRAAEQRRVSDAGPGGAGSTQAGSPPRTSPSSWGLTREETGHVRGEPLRGRWRLYALTPAAIGADVERRGWSRARGVGCLRSRCGGAGC